MYVYDTNPIYFNLMLDRTRGIQHRITSSSQRCPLESTQSRILDSYVHTGSPPSYLFLGLGL